jgi:hypothetical protein
MAATDDFNQLRDSYLDFLREEVSGYLHKQHWLDAL